MLWRYSSHYRPCAECLRTAHWDVAPQYSFYGSLSPTLAVLVGWRPVRVPRHLATFCHTHAWDECLRRNAELF